MLSRQLTGGLGLEAPATVELASLSDSPSLYPVPTKCEGLFLAVPRLDSDTSSAPCLIKEQKSAMQDIV